MHLIHFIHLQTKIYPENNFNLIKTDFSFFINCCAAEFISISALYDLQKKKKLM